MAASTYSNCPICFFLFVFTHSKKEKKLSNHQPVHKNKQWGLFFVRLLCHNAGHIDVLTPNPAWMPPPVPCSNLVNRTSLIFTNGSSAKRAQSSAFLSVPFGGFCNTFLAVQLSRLLLWCLLKCLITASSKWFFLVVCGLLYSLLQVVFCLVMMIFQNGRRGAKKDPPWTTTQVELSRLPATQKPLEVG